jgi:hypothetical protein
MRVIPETRRAHKKGLKVPHDVNRRRTDNQMPNRKKKEKMWNTLQKAKY